MNVLGHLGMVRKPTSRKTKKSEHFIAYNSAWVRASASGIISDTCHLGDQVEKGTRLATIGSPYGDTVGTVEAPRAGIIIGKQNIPLVQEGDALFHIAFFKADANLHKC